MHIKFLRALSAWLQDSKGVTALEFALVGLPFILMIVGTIEMALMFTAQSVLQESTFTAARLIRTGQIQQSGSDPQQMFREAVCDFAESLIPCSRIQFQVQQVPSFGNAEDLPQAEFDEDGNLQDQGFDPGGVSDVVLIRVAYNYPIMTPMMQAFLATDGNESRSMVSTIVLRSEPYEFEEE
jgi:Flp pilus assembly protein TadG